LSINQRYSAAVPRFRFLAGTTASFVGEDEEATTGAEGGAAGALFGVPEGFSGFTVPFDAGAGRTRTFAGAGGFAEPARCCFNSSVIDDKEPLALVKKYKSCR